ncbi:type VI secretion system baseplate subunit TssK [Pseudoalteromonas luteoviolacea]|uniref:Type VI secretion protein n=1 Tax=Pseudoalteromonas luteoviolacea S4054 TaxID=1129367 RepID=A0A0F6A8Z2_9GAMM|nr:type VI secretion system baseplate subunit TssK [Pseudoalteromonas luteoviolacea]AOT10923.1 type VI secretion system-associated protein [Pseudoalteromonas luteoviolacea]AOT15913.1 type VI secretion system-associated protein [Pseudoalteromonas luteoviolacea]AOT20744.1 type VI secretion system-associated protein [Pseudoalteromonas luteoviolacea]KKE81849.1 hypothetical protein N479_02495 [Pseudoalteromonas luteoviolacea S4054]KZN66193.1 hypothetical protein N481_24585 [Pseudoalteromonas luteov
MIFDNLSFKPVWAEGVMLSQQHFQHLDKHLQSEMAARSRLSQKVPYGFYRLQFDESAIAKGVVKLLAVSVIFKSGRLIEMSFTDSDALTYELDDGQQSVTLSLALATNHAVSDIKGYPQNGQLSAYQCEFVELQDEHDPARGKEVMVAKPKLMLIESSSSQSFIEQLQCAKVITNEQGEFAFDTHFVPSLLNVRVHAPTFSRLNSAGNVLNAKYQALQSSRAQMGVVEDFGPSDLKQFMLLQAMSANMPYLNHLLLSQYTHPEDMYIAMSTLLTQLAHFEAEQQIDIPPYQHDNLGQIFGYFESQIQQLIGSISTKRSANLPLEKLSDSMFEVTGFEADQFRNNEFYLAAFFEHESTQWIELFADQVKVAASSQIEILIASALGGAELTHCQRPPSKVSLKGGYEYFKINASSAAWAQIKQELSLRIFVPYSLQSVQIELVSVTK